MKQVLQNLRNGATSVAEVPCPAAGPGQLLIRSRCTLLSTGTEKMLVDFGKAGWLEKIKQQPDKVKAVLDKVRTDGLLATVETVRNKLGQPLPMGYCNVGEVVAVGEGVTGFKAGDRVASNGRHAEFVVVPRNLCARIPENVSDEDAAFTVLGAIALQGIRLVQPTLGECVVVTGLGLIGLLTVQLLQAQGCRVLGVDFDQTRLDLAKSFGADVVNPRHGEGPIAAALRFSRGRGVDAVLITASTQSSEPIHQAALMCRKRGRIVLVGVTGLELSRADFYEKELTFQVSCSYGPGRYDPQYEEKGQDYPIGFVRWTEHRNFEAVLDMLATRRLHLQTMISHRFSVDAAAEAYEVVSSGVPSLGILLNYPVSAREHETNRTVVTIAQPPANAPARAVTGVVGAGNYASAILVPAFAESGARLHTIVSVSGVSGAHLARKHSFENAATDAASVMQNVQIDTVVVATRHDTHARLVLEARAHGKHVFVEKPLCLQLKDVDRIEEAYRGTAQVLMVGFNRRFAPHVVRMKQLLDAVRAPKTFVMTINAGAIPPDHWTQDPRVGGGRIVGECCHFIDLLRHLAGAAIVEQTILSMQTQPADTVTINLTFADGSIAAIHYFANGSKRYPKERVEVFAQGGVLQLDNYRRLSGFGWPGFTSMKLWRQDKGQRACVRAFVEAVRQGGRPPIALDEILEVSRVAIQLQQAVQ